MADANLISNFAIVGINSPIARRVFAKDRIWIAPSLWRSEVLSVLSGKLRRNECSIEDAEAMFLYAQSLMQDFTFPVDFRHILAIANRTKCSSYDSHYVALAEEKQVRLVTSDNGILVNASHVAVSPEQFLAA